MVRYESVGIMEYFTNSSPKVHYYLKSRAQDFIVQEITNSGVCSSGPIYCLHSFLEAIQLIHSLDKNLVSIEDKLLEFLEQLMKLNTINRLYRPELIDYSLTPKLLRTRIYDVLRYFPFATCRTEDNVIKMKISEVNTFTFVLVKKLLNTVDACRWVGIKLDANIRFSGNKDKKAITYQEVSAKCSFTKVYELAKAFNNEEDELMDDVVKLFRKFSSSTDEQVSSLNLNENCQTNGCTLHTDGNSLDSSKSHRLLVPESPCIKLCNIRQSGHKKLGDIKGNRFTVKVPVSVNMECFAQGFLNYYGQQRFGKNLDNHKIGKLILNKEYDDAVDLILKNCSKGDSTERYIMKCINKSKKSILLGLKREVLMLYLHSYQSYKFNLEVNKRIRKGKEVLVGDLVMIGKFCDRSHDSLGNYRSELQEKSVLTCLTMDDSIVKIRNIPKNMEVIRVTAENIKSFTINDVVLELERCNHKMLKGGVRKLVEKPYDICYKKDGDAIILSFSLNTSCYATMALREIIEEIDNTETGKY